MQLTNLLVVAAAIGASAAPTKELHARASGVKLSKIAGKWKVGWPAGSKTSEQYTCSNNGLLVSASSCVPLAENLRARLITSFRTS
jgi:hypothetical protein